MRKPTVSVIIPIYNGEEFLKRTIRSLQKQHFNDFEILFVDDNSTDSSPEILQLASKTDNRFKFIKTPYNLGIVSKVMNFAKEHVAGEFFVYSSQDDFFSRDWLTKMVLRAKETGADAVLPDLVFSTGDDPLDKKIIGIKGDRRPIIDGKTAFQLSLDWTIPGNALWKTHFLRDIGFFDFGMYADEYTVRFFFLNCKSVAFCNGIFYYFQGNPNAITKAISPKRLDSAYNYFRLYELARANNCSNEVVSNCSRKAALSLIESAATTFRYADLKNHRHRLGAAIECMNDPVFLDHLIASLEKNWLRRFLIPAAVRFRPILYCVAAAKVALTRHSK